MTALMSERIRRNRITAKAAQRREPPSYIDWNGHELGGTVWWDVTLSIGRGEDRRQLTVPFGLGPAFMGKPPDALHVLSCLCEDAAGWENADGFEDWAREYGSAGDGSDSANTQLYQRVTDGVKRLRRFLGEAYEDYVWDTEDV
jgi:hypothetical protein